MRYEVQWNDGALDSMAEVEDRRIQRKLFDLLMVWRTTRTCGGRC